MSSSPRVTDVPLPRARTRRSPWAFLGALTLALLLTFGIAIVGLFRPVAAKPQPETFSAEQVTSAKAKVCSRYELVRKAVVTNTSRNGGEDPTATLAVAANARVALYNGGDYLSNALLQEPAAPPELIKAVHTLVDAYQKLAFDYLAEMPESEQQLSRDAVSNAGTRVYGLCQ